MAAPDEGERHVEGNNGDEEEVPRRDDSGEGCGKSEGGHAREREQDSEAEECEGDEKDTAELVSIEK